MSIAPVKFIRSAHRDKIALGAVERQVRYDARISIFPIERHVSPHLIAQNDVGQPGIIDFWTIEIDDVRIPEASVYRPLL